MKISKKFIFLFLFITSISSSKAQDSIVSFFNETDSVYMFHTLLDAYTFHFSGVMAIKKLENQHRIIFSTETGSTLFDFTIEKNKCKTNYIMKEMKNPIFVKLIKSDLVDLVATYNYSNKNYHLENEIKNLNTSTSSEIITIYFKNKENSSKEYIYLSNTQGNNSPNNISIVHKSLPVKIELTHFYNTTEN